MREAINHELSISTRVLNNLSFILRNAWNSITLCVCVCVCVCVLEGRKRDSENFYNYIPQKSNLPSLEKRGHGKGREGLDLLNKHQCIY